MKPLHNIIFVGLCMLLLVCCKDSEAPRSREVQSPTTNVQVLEVVDVTLDEETYGLLYHCGKKLPPEYLQQLERVQLEEWETPGSGPIYTPEGSLVASVDGKHYVYAFYFKDVSRVDCFLAKFEAEKRNESLYYTLSEERHKSWRGPCDLELMKLFMEPEEFEFMKKSLKQMLDEKSKDERKHE